MNQNQPQIDSKSLTLLQDQMKHVALAFKKSELYSGYLADPNLKDLACSVAQHHKTHFNDMMNYLNSHQ
ncbi:MAG: hypothetical protein ACOYI4_02665 [Christensenellales bacterium]|jgi:hypothetical protein